MKINLNYYDDKGTIESMNYHFTVYSDEHGSVELLSGDKKSGLGTAATFISRKEMLEIVDELCTSYPKINITYSLYE